MKGSKQFVKNLTVTMVHYRLLPVTPPRCEALVGRGRATKGFVAWRQIRPSHGHETTKRFVRGGFRGVCVVDPRGNVSRNTPLPDEEFRCESRDACPRAVPDPPLILSIDSAPRTSLDESLVIMSRDYREILRPRKGLEKNPTGGRFRKDPAKMPGCYDMAELNVPPHLETMPYVLRLKKGLENPIEGLAKAKDRFRKDSIEIPGYDILVEQKVLAHLEMAYISGFKDGGALAVKIVNELVEQ